MNLSTRFIERPIATGLLMAAIALLGALSYRLLPVAGLADGDTPTLQVVAQLPGADPQTMASSVATPLERQFGEIPGLRQMTSSSALGYTQITLQFDRARSIDSAAEDVQSAINATSGELPATLLNPPIYRKVNPADTPILLIAMTSDTLPLTKVSDYANSILAQKLSQMPGIGLVSVGGAQDPAIRVQVNPAQLAAAGLDLETVRTALSTSTVNQPKGVLYGGEHAYSLLTNDQLTTAPGFNDYIIAYRNGAPIRVRDIGRAVVAPEDTTLAGWLDNKRAVLIQIQRQPGANVIETVDAIKRALPQLQASLPPGIDVEIVSDRTQTIRASVADVQFTLLLTIALVVGVIFLFLRRVWATVIPAIAVPLSLVGTFVVMYALGFSLDNLSLMALTIAVGFVVDDAVVMIENIARHLEAGLTPMQAAIKGAGEIGFTILSISISLIAVFIPLFLMSGVVGLLFREFAVTVAAAIVVSVIVSLTLTPMMCARLLTPESEGGAGRLSRALERVFDSLLELYDRALVVVLRHRFIGLMTMILTVALTVALFVIIPKGFFPQQDTGLIVGISEGAQDISPQAMMSRQAAILDIAARDPAVASAIGYIGPGGATVTENDGRVFITLKPHGQRTASADEVIARLDRALQPVEGVRLYMQAAQDINVGARLSKTQYQFTLVDVDSAELDHWAPILLGKLSELAALADVASDQQSAGQTLKINIDRDVASRVGVDPAVVDTLLYDAFGQRHVARIFTNLNQYYVILEVDPSYQLGPNALGRIYAKSANGTMTPLSELASVSRSIAPLAINHQGQFPSVTLSFNLAAGHTIGEAVAAIRRTVDGLKPPTSLATSFQGNAQAFESSLGSTPILIVAALIAVYLILGMLYESLIHPITIISTLPSAGLGALLTLMLVGRPLDVIGIIGIILLIGIVKKNGIMLVDFALHQQREGGMTSEEAIHTACRLRFRPILMTTLCAILGGVPLMLGTGTGSEIRQPLGYAIVGGLIVSQLLTLFTTPIVYLYMDRLRSGRVRNVSPGSMGYSEPAGGRTKIETSALGGGGSEI
jgi:hydrophobe/amphiphile efflux-1 (HAE1) family protein